MPVQVWHNQSPVLQVHTLQSPANNRSFPEVFHSSVSMEEWECMKCILSHKTIIARQHSYIGKKPLLLKYVVQWRKCYWLTTAMTFKETFRLFYQGFSRGKLLLFTLEQLLETFPAHTLLLNHASFPTTIQQIFFILGSILQIELLRMQYNFVFITINNRFNYLQKICYCHSCCI